MDHHFSSMFGRSLAALLISMGLLLIFGAPASAQAESTATAVVSPTATISATATVEATECITPTVAAAKAADADKAAPENLGWLVLMTLVFAALVLGGMFWYTYLVQMKFYELTALLSRAGIALRMRVTNTFSPAGDSVVLRDAGDGKETAQYKLTLEGPDTVTIGTQSEEFTATLDPDDAQKEIAWTITPSENAVVRPATGKKVTVIAFKTGTYTLKATIKVGEQEISAEASIKVVAPEGYAIDLPFVGSGHGTLAIAIVLLTAVIVLGFANVLSAEGVTGLLGTLLGYIFGVKVADAGKEAKKE